MYAIRSYYGQTISSGSMSLKASRRAHFSILPFPAFPESFSFGFMRMATSINSLSRKGTLPSTPHAAKDFRITSYNVCYTKLLRPDRNPRGRCRFSCRPRKCCSCRAAPRYPLPCGKTRRQYGLRNGQDRYGAPSRTFPERARITSYNVCYTKLLRSQ